MAAVSGRAGLFTIKENFNPGLYDQVEATTRGQKSGAYRFCFGKVVVTGAVSSVAVNTTVNTGVAAVVIPATNYQISTNVVSGHHYIWTSGSFLSAQLTIGLFFDGQYSGKQDALELNYMAVGY